jgi:hypothetical protein
VVVAYPRRQALVDADEGSADLGNQLLEGMAVAAEAVPACESADRGAGIRQVLG